MYLRSAVTAYITNASGHIGKTLNCFGKVLNGFFGVAVFNHLIPPIRASDASFKKAKPAVQ